MGSPPLSSVEKLQHPVSPACLLYRVGQRSGLVHTSKRGDGLVHTDSEAELLCPVNEEELYSVGAASIREQF